MSRTQVVLDSIKVIFMNDCKTLMGLLEQLDAALTGRMVSQPLS